jgi:hypothetical protein
MTFPEFLAEHFPTQAPKPNDIAKPWAGYLANLYTAATGLDEALIGYTINTHHAHVAVYSARKCVEVLVERDGMTAEEADEYLEFNTYCCYVGPNGPLFFGGGEQ